MSDKELIKQRLKDLLKENEHHQHNDSIQESLDKASKCILLDELLQFIDSLPEETASKDLDFQTFAEEMHTVFALPSSETKNTEEDPLNWEYAIARHFAEWGRNHFEDKSEMVSEDFEEDCSFEKILQEIYIKYDKKISIESLLDIARHFAEWQRNKDAVPSCKKLYDAIKEGQEKKSFHDDFEKASYAQGMIDGSIWQKQQMMKDAVEAEVFIDYNINFGYGSLTANIDLDEQHLKEGDKVKIIIVKED